MIIGAWNPAIITPDWLRQQFPDLFPGDQFEAEFITTGALTIRFTINNVQINPSNGRLVLSCRTNDLKTFESVAVIAQAIADKLPHTPVAAVGMNFVFQASRETVLAVDRFLDQPGQDQFYAALGLGTRIGRRITHSFALPENILNLTYEYKPEGITLKFNFHNDVTSTQQVHDKLGRFTDLLSESKRLLETIDPEN